MKNSKSPISGTTYNQEISLCVLVDNYVEGGVDTFLKTLLPRLKIHGGRILLYVNSTYPNLELLFQTCSETVEIVTFTSIFHRTWFTRLGSSMRSTGTERVLGGLRRCTEYFFLPFEILHLRHRLRVPQGVPFLVINGGYPGSYVCLASVFAFSSSSEVFMNFHNLPPKRTRLLSFLETALDRGIARRVKMFIGVSKTSEIALKTRFRHEQLSSTYVHNAIDSTPKPLTGSRQGGPPHTENLTIGLIGSYDARKGHFFALEVLNELQRSFTNEIRLRFVGSDPFDIGKKLRSNADRLGVSSNLIFENYKTNRSEIYTGLDLVIIPSVGIGESFCLVAIEALAEGVPVLAASTGALAEVLQGLSSCRLINSLDVREWAQSIYEFLEEGASCVPKTADLRLLRFLNPHEMAREYEAIIDASRS